MATSQVKKTVRRQLLIEEESSPPSGQGSPPCQDVAGSQRPQSPGSPRRDILEIARNFEACCDQVLAALTASTGSQGGGGVCEANTNLVRPNLEEMMNLLQVAQAYVEERSCHTNQLKQVINQTLTALDGFRGLVEQLEPVVAGGLRMVPDYVEMWSNHSEGFANMHHCLTSENPVPNIDVCNHPSPTVTQENFGNLVWQMMSLCSAAERQCRVGELMYSKLDEDRLKIRQTLDQTERGLQYFVELSTTMEGEDQALLNQFEQLHLQVSQFLEEWEKGGDHLNEPSLSPMTSPEQIQPEQSPVPCGSGMRGPYFSPSTSPGSPQTPTPELQERLRTLDSTRNRKKEILEDLVQRYADLHGSILNEVKNIRDQNEVHNESMIAMQSVQDRGVSSPPETPRQSREARASQLTPVPPPAATPIPEPTPPADSDEEAPAS